MIFKPHQPSVDMIHFQAIIQDLLHNQKVIELEKYKQHLNTSRLDHSLNVAYTSFLLAKKKNVNVIETVRAALLHDFFLYEWRTEQPIKGSHVDVHPQQAL